MSHKCPIALTPQAAQEIKQIFDQKKIPEGYLLRVGIKGGGCGAPGFVIGFDTPKEHDVQFHLEQIDLLIDKKHFMYLLDIELDFEDRHDERGFIFRKPNEK